MSSDVKTPNPCLLTPEEQMSLLAILKKTIIRLGMNSLPTAPSNTPFGAADLGPNLRLNGILLDTIQDIQTISTPSFAGLVINGITYPNSIAINQLLYGLSGGQIGAFTTPGFFNILASDGSGNLVWVPVAANLNLTSVLDTVQNIQLSSTVQFAKLGIGAAVGASDVFRVAGITGLGSDKFRVDANGLPIKSNNVNLVSQGFDLIVASGNATGQTGAITSICSFTTLAAGGSFEIGGYLDVTAFTAGTISLICDYTDPGGTARTLTIPLIALAGTISGTIGSVTDASAVIAGIQTSGVNTIKIYTTVNLFTGTYNAYAWIKQIA